MVQKPTTEELRSTIEIQVKVNYPAIEAAARFLRENVTADRQQVLPLAKAFAQEVSGVGPMEELAIGSEGTDLDELLARRTRSLTSLLAAFRAASLLVEAGEYAAMSWASWEEKLPLRRHHSPTNSSSERLDLSFLRCPYPERLLVWPRQVLVEQRMNLPTARLPSGLRRAISDARRCQVQGLYLPCLVMLASAMETLWERAGEKLVEAAPDDDPAKEKAESALRGRSLELKLM